MIEVRKTDAFTMGGGSLFFYRKGACYVIRKNGSVDIVPYARTSNEYDIPHSLAFELMKCMGHDPVYVEDAPSPKPVADPQEEWREAVTEWVKYLRDHTLAIGTINWKLSTRVIEAAGRMKAKENQK